MKRSGFITLKFVFFILIFSGCREEIYYSWKPVDGYLFTRWSAAVDPDSVWQQYPRPQMVRDEWLNLNGLWDYAIVQASEEPEIFEGKILVPFPVESALSGVARQIGQDHMLWYKRSVEIPANWNEKTILLHFEASDWETTVWVDGRPAGTHRGGYDPFHFDITSLVSAGQTHELKVAIWDPTSDGSQPRGKQVNEPGGIWYTSTTGIWQTVWLEPVEKSYFRDLQIETDIDKNQVIIESNIVNQQQRDRVEISVIEDTTIIYQDTFKTGEIAVIGLEHPYYWSPGQPFLYGLQLKLIRDDRVIDQVDSYFGMRKIGLKKDARGFTRLALNNEIMFQNGPLDQGFWPDGIYTPPSDEAMKYDIEMTLQMGFNMLRKHVKVENRRFYCWCDKLGILVWQDMPSASGYVAPGGDDLQPSEEHQEIFERELTQMINTHFNHPSIVMWVPFNEGWGQYDTKRIVNLVSSLDATRLIDNASGWEDRGVGDVLDIHHYPDPRSPEPQKNRASVLGEFGGLGYYVEGHSWQQENWGYEKLQSLDELLIKYEDFYGDIFRMRDEEGLAASIYTQTTDVETETNGLMTYDRALVKMGTGNIRKAHEGIIPPRLASPFRQFVENYNIELTSTGGNVKIYFTLDGQKPDIKSTLYSGPVKIDQNTTLKTFALWPDGQTSRINTYRIVKADPHPSIRQQVENGLQVSYYEGNWDSLPDFDALNPVQQGISVKPDLTFSNKEELFGLVFTGYLDIPQTAIYNIYLSSDDGGRVYLDEQVLIDYDGIHGPGIRKTSVALEEGLHVFRLAYFQRYGGLGLSLSWEGPGIEYQEIESKFWKH